MKVEMKMEMEMENESEKMRWIFVHYSSTTGYVTYSLFINYGL